VGLHLVAGEDEEAEEEAGSEEVAAQGAPGGDGEDDTRCA
jgi:hypothetical protein